MSDRRASRLRRPVLLAVGVLVVAGCAQDRSAYPHAGQSGGWTDGSVARTVLLYLVLPVAIAVGLGALTVLPGARRRYRYRPQEGWSAEPVWFAGPPDPVRAVAEAQPDDLVRGGAGGAW